MELHLALVDDPITSSFLKTTARVDKMFASFLSSAITSERSLPHESASIASSNLEKKRRRRKRMLRWRISPITLHMSDRMLLQDPNSQSARDFKVRYRMSYKTFMRFIDIVRGKHVFDDLEEKVDAVGNPSAPLELKIASCIRLLGRGNPYDDLEELSGISAEVIRNFLQIFAFRLVETFFESWIDAYRDGPHESYLSPNTYEKFPGCIGSIDSVQVLWENCVYDQKNKYVGRQAKPALVFSVVVDHNRRILYCSSGYSGKNNDKTIMHYDNFISRVSSDPRFTNFSYDLLKVSDGNVIRKREQGVYLLCDGGYARYSYMQCPSRHASDWRERKLSALIESLRKDVECTFGILKKRFRFLKYPIILRDKRVISNIFIACCILHNFLLTEQDDTPSQEVYTEREPEEPRALRFRLQHQARELRSRAEEVRDFKAKRERLVDHLLCLRYSGDD